jgi:hypothetical protein
MHPTRTMIEHLLAHDDVPEKTKGLLIDLTVLISDQTELMADIDKRVQTLSEQYNILEKELNNQKVALTYSDQKRLTSSSDA